MTKYTSRFRNLFFALLSASAMSVSATDFEWYNGCDAVTCHVQEKVEPVVRIALQMFSSDMKAVTGKDIRTVENAAASIRIVELDKVSKTMRKSLKDSGVPVDKLEKKIDGFHICVANGQIIVTGANGRGTDYGLLELSRLAGVSPWVWWGDVIP